MPYYFKKISDLSSCKNLDDTLMKNTLLLLSQKNQTSENDNDTQQHYTSYNIDLLTLHNHIAKPLSDNFNNLLNNLNDWKLSTDENLSILSTNILCDYQKLSNTVSSEISTLILTLNNKFNSLSSQISTSFDNLSNSISTEVSNIRTDLFEALSNASVAISNALNDRFTEEWKNLSTYFTQNYVTLSSEQTITAKKTFTDTITFNSDINGIALSAKWAK